jgi:hypothetical protein
MILVSRSSDRRLEGRYHAAIPLVLSGIALLPCSELTDVSSTFDALSEQTVNLGQKEFNVLCSLTSRI